MVLANPPQPYNFCALPLNRAPLDNVGPMPIVSRPALLLVLLSFTPFLSPAAAQEPLQFNVSYHCQDGTGKVITRCQSNARCEVCTWRDEKNSQVLVERFNIRSQMDGWLKICKVDAKATAPAAAQSPAQSATEAVL